VVAASPGASRAPKQFFDTVAASVDLKNTS
jgi:hypothetical protein